MIKHVLFLKWVFFAVVVGLGAMILNKGDFLLELWLKDYTKISFLIIALTLASSLWCGLKTYITSVFRDRVMDLDTKKLIQKEQEYWRDSAKKEITPIARSEEEGWFISDQCFTLGMIGTVIGFILMLASFGNVNVQDVKSVQDVLGSLGSGMATALYTTLVGLVCGLILKVQYFNLGSGLDDIREAVGLNDEEKE